MAQRELAIVLRAAGKATVREMLLEASVLPAQEMKTRGFIQRVVPDDRLQHEAFETAQRIAALSPQAARLNKQFLRQLFETNRPIDGMKSARSATHSIAKDSYAYAASAEHIEGITAFLEKRSAQF
jgi:enoyl-CoA hydratase/carnithine racemase